MNGRGGRIILGVGLTIGGAAVLIWKVSPNIPAIELDASTVDVAIVLVALGVFLTGTRVLMRLLD